jgi:hypothetical protein
MIPAITFNVLFPIIEGYIDSVKIKKTWYINHVRNIIIVAISYLIFFSVVDLRYIIPSSAIYWLLHDLSLNIFMGLAFVIQR